MSFDFKQELWIRIVVFKNYKKSTKLKILKKWNSVNDWYVELLPSCELWTAFQILIIYFVMPSSLFQPAPFMMAKLLLRIYLVCEVSWRTNPHQLEWSWPNLMPARAHPARRAHYICRQSAVSAYTDQLYTVVHEIRRLLLSQHEI